jgi:hypothetical protein
MARDALRFRFGMIRFSLHTSPIVRVLNFSVLCGHNVGIVKQSRDDLS